MSGYVEIMQLGQEPVKLRLGMGVSTALEAYEKIIGIDGDHYLLYSRGLDNMVPIHWDDARTFHLEDKDHLIIMVRIMGYPEDSEKFGKTPALRRRDKEVMP